MLLVFDVQAKPGVLPASYTVGDTSREFATSGLEFNVQAKPGALPESYTVGDTSREFVAGGLQFDVQAKPGVLPASYTVGDTCREFVPGGLQFNVQAKPGAMPASYSVGDTFRIPYVQLGEHSFNAYMIRRTIKPPGFPWLQDEVTTVAWCWKIDFKDGTVMGFTSHDRDLIINGVTYEASTGFAPTAVETSRDMAVDNLDVEGMIDSERITNNDIAAGKYDGAQVIVFLCNWKNPDDPICILRKGTIGQISYDNTRFTAEIRGLMQAYQQTSADVYQKTCRATFGDAKCKLNSASYTFAGTVTAVNFDGSFYTDLIKDDKYFDYGLIKFDANPDKSFEIKQYTRNNGQIRPFLPLPFKVFAGNTFSIAVGCDGNFSTCKNKFNNVVNFRGEPHIPGNDYAASYPART